MNEKLKDCIEATDIHFKNQIWNLEPYNINTSIFFF